MRGDNCVIFTTKNRMELRVVFDPDGTAFFCGADLAAIAGYAMPKKLVTNGNQGVNRIDSVLRKVPWDNGLKRGRCDFTCFTAENAVKLLCRRPAPYEYIRWFEDEVIPETQKISEKVARGYVNWVKEAVPAEEQPSKESRALEQELPASQKPHQEVSQLPVFEVSGSILERLDAIILECALLKRELSQAK